MIRTYSHNKSYIFYKYILQEKSDTSPSRKVRKYLDFLDILLSARDDNDAGLTDLEIRNEVDTFLFEGHDTTASGLTWMLYSLSKHTEIQRKAQEEVDAVMDAKGSEYIDW